MQKFNTLEDAIQLAKFAHRKQFDQAGLPYYRHPKRVMKSVQAQGALPYVQMAAVLHDVTEDTAFSVDMLRALGLPEGAVNIVALVDRHYSKKQYDMLMEMRDAFHGQTKARFDDPELSEMLSRWDMTVLGKERATADEFYYLQINQNRDARMVKLADIADNLQEWRLAYLSPERQDKLRAKYAKAQRLLGVRESHIATSGIKGAVPA